LFALLKFVILIAIAVLGAAFASINSDVITVNYYFGNFEIPLGVFIFSSLAIGTLIGAVASSGYLISTKAENMGLRRQIRHSEQEIQTIKNANSKTITGL